MTINSLKSIKNLKDKKVLLRVDYNVPMKDGEISDDFRIKSSLNTINYLIEKEAKIIIISHLGRAKGKFAAQYSLEKVAIHLKKLLDKPVFFVKEYKPLKAKKIINDMKAGEIIFLENMRFNPGELSNDPVFAKDLASLADIYVNDAFSVCHRKQASVAAVKEYLPSYAGFIIEKEVIALTKILNPKKPLIAIMGGVKISTKAPLIFNLYNQVDKILIGGALANIYFKSLGKEIGKSFCEDGIDEKILKKMKDKKYLKKIILPIDVVVKDKKGVIRISLPEKIKKGEAVFDIGPETISLFSKYIKTAETLIWNGPMGMFEEHAFRQGSLSIARSIASRAKGPSFGVIGGGETIEVLKMTQMSDYVDYISTAGGAMLSFLSGKSMPGLEKIVS